ncbi:hypothetical protein DFR49_3523 [Hephaestia caeni]|uniref:Uncharacterized protein n=1 Tax=Hephaestia caeni TaxID=645617 RepID=A0A397NJC7_9SPHN|nr:hypothetical protein [Hephaestia caeni]RIA37636.1 hypothetical protein DFR49_3523 [Hephaestia caeni]
MPVYLTSPADVDDAVELVTRFGATAASEAALRADRSRTLGNAIHFCRWRQIGRLIALMGVEEAVGTVH